MQGITSDPINYSPEYTRQGLSHVLQLESNAKSVSHSLYEMIESGKPNDCSDVGPVEVREGDVFMLLWGCHPGIIGTPITVKRSPENGELYIEYWCKSGHDFVIEPNRGMLYHPDQILVLFNSSK